MTASSTTTSGVDERVILLLEASRDADSIPRVLREVGVTALLVVTPEAVCAEIEKGAGALIVGEELISSHTVTCLRNTLSGQPSWSELPIMVLLRHGPETGIVQNTLQLPGDVTPIERPVRVKTLVAHVQAALRSRRRQYLVRDQMLELERSEKRYRTLFNSIDEGFCVVRMIFDESGKAVDYLFLETNPAFERHTGLIQAEGKSVRQLVDVVEESWLETYGAVALQGESIRFSNFAAGLNRWFDVYAFRYGDPLDREVAILFSDVTEKREAEDALRNSEKKFATIFHSAPALVGISTLKDGRIVDINDAALRFLGYRREELIGRTTQQIGLWQSGHERDLVVRRIEEKGSLHDVEVSFRGKAGENYTGLFSAAIIHIGEEPYLLSMVKDITERKVAQQEIERLNADLAVQVEDLKEANVELEAFNRMVSHDLRQPLNAMGLIIQAVEMMCEETLDDECKGYLHSLYERVSAMNNLINTLLKFSGSTRAEVQRASVDLSDIARSVATELRESAPQRRVTFDIAPGLTAHADPGLVRTVLQNLVGNAWKYTGLREEAVIEVGVTEEEGERAFFVRDNGEGFDMADAEDIFAPFKRLPGADAFRGFGVGLATVERIIRRHGGRIWADAERGKGATFFFTLPE